MKLCIDCGHYIEPKAGLDPETYGKCAHPKNVKFRLDASPITGKLYPEPTIEYECDTLIVMRKFDVKCGIQATWYEPKPLTTLVKQATGETA
jgi:hypothetical protein